MGGEKTLIVSPELCTGCRICELTCSLEKFGEFNPKKSLIRVLFNRDMGVYIPVLRVSCDFCGKCVDKCPTSAIELVDTCKAALLRKKVKLPRFPAPLISSQGEG